MGYDVCMSCCVVCNGALPKTVSRGKPRKYCSNACRQEAYRRRVVVESGFWVPDGLKALDRWVWFRLVRRGGRLAKVPWGVSGAVDVTDSSGWMCFEDALAGVSGFDGVGVVLGGGLACLDIDHCVGEGGVVSDVALGVLDATVGAFVERSVSGCGLHVFGCAPELPGRVSGGVEAYSCKRFIAVTGIVFREGGLDVDLSGWF